MRRARAEETDTCRRDNAERMKTIRSQRREGSSHCTRWNNLRALQNPNPIAIRLENFRSCSHCKTQLLHEETETFCCRNGEIFIPPLPNLPENWLEMFQTRIFRINARQYNNLFAFTAIGVTGNDGFIHQPVPSCVRIHGRTYHRILPADMKGPIHWYVHDPEQRTTEANAFSLNQHYVDIIQQTLMNFNPYARNLRQLGQEPAEDINLHVIWKEESKEIAAIIHRIDSNITGPRTVVFWKRGKLTANFINPLNPLYEPLQYPLFFPYGTNGWFSEMRSVQPSHKKISQMMYYRFRILTEKRFGQLGRLFNEYLVDMFSSLEDNRLNYIRQHVQTRIAARRELDDTNNNSFNSINTILHTMY